MYCVIHLNHFPIKCQNYHSGFHGEAERRESCVKEKHIFVIDSFTFTADFSIFI